MSQGDRPKPKAKTDVSNTSKSRHWGDWFSIPGPMKKLFDQVPVLIYPPNELPLRAPQSVKSPALYVFSKERDAAMGKPSFNPSCLKWQTFLKIADVDHKIVSSNNHASPTGSLPFLLPAIHGNTDTEVAPAPISSSKLLKYVTEHGGKPEESLSIRCEAYQSLLDHRIRNAWLYSLYLEPSNFAAVAYPLYVSATTSNFIVRAATAYHLKAAAEAELLKHSSMIDVDDLYSEADKAFEALSILLGNDTWFFGTDRPALFDASVFAYTHLLLQDDLGWIEGKLCRALRTRENLVQHRERLFVRYF